MKYTFVSIYKNELLFHCKNEIMKLTLSGIKDIDRHILLFLPDKDLLIVCGLNKYFFTVICDNNFFHKKLATSYPDTLNGIDKNIKYKRLYLRIVSYVLKLKTEFNYSYAKGYPHVKYHLLLFNPDPQKLIYASIREGDFEMVKEAIKRGAVVSEDDNYAIKYATKYGQLEIVKYLVELDIGGVKVTNIHAGEECALRLASKYGYLDIVKYLVENGADISANNNEALKEARENNRLKIVEYLTGL